MISSVYVTCAIILSLCAVQAVGFVRWKRVFRIVNQLLWILSPALLAAAVGCNAGYMLGAAEQYLVIPGAHRSVMTEPGGQPIPYAVIFFLLLLAALTLVLRLIDDRRQRKTQ